MSKIKVALYLSAFFPYLSYGADDHFSAAAGGGSAAAMTVVSGASAAGHPVKIEEKSIADLKSFFLSNAGSMRFPEKEFDAFVKPFTQKFSSLKKLEQIQARNEAANNISQAAALAYVCFTKFLEAKKETFYISGAPVKVASRPEAQAAYLETAHPRFLIFQHMLNRLLELESDAKRNSAEANAVLTAPFGTSAHYNIAWTRDDNGIVPVSLALRLRSTPLYYAPMPYGFWGNSRGKHDNLQRALTLQKAVPQPSPCFVFQYKTGDTFIKTLQQNGASGGFVTNPITARIGLGADLTKYILDSDILKHIEGNTYCGLITMPDTPAEDQEFEAAFLEELRDAAKEGDRFSAKFLEYYGEYLIEDGTVDEAGVAEGAVIATSSAAAASSAGAAPADLKIQGYIDSLYEDTIRKEQEAISKAVAEGSITGRLKKKNKGKSKAAGGVGAPASAAVVPDEDVAAKAKVAKASILGELKKQGRVKWRDLVKVVCLALSNAFTDGAISLHFSAADTRKSAAAVTTGSHIALHLKGSEASDGITLVRPHGKKDRTLSAGEARSFAGSLIDLTYKLMSGR